VEATAADLSYCAPMALVIKNPITKSKATKVIGEIAGINVLLYQASPFVFTKTTNFNIPKHFRQLLVIHFSKWWIHHQNQTYCDRNICRAYAKRIDESRTRWKKKS